MADETSFRILIAQLWRGILHANWDEFFSAAPTLGIDRHRYDRLPQPGYVGFRYQPGGVVLVAQNPANDSRASGLSPSDRQQYQLLENLRDAGTEDDLVRCFDELMRALGCIMPSWKVYRNAAGPLLDRLGLTFDSVAYVNLVKFRTATASIPRQIYDRAWLSTNEQFVLLNPGIVVALGDGVFSKVVKRMGNENRSANAFRLRRSIGDTYLPKTFSEDCESIVAALHRAGS